MSTHTQHIHRQLILECQQGMHSAQEQLYKLYAPAMFNVCLRMLGDDEWARDLLQDSFVDVFRKVSGLREVDYFSAWIKRIVTNNCINALRKKQLDTVDMDSAEEPEDEEEISSDFYDGYQRDQVKMAIEQLPKGCRTVLNLYVFEGYDHQEIGDILQISESASKAQYSKAKKRIREQLMNTPRSHVG